MHRLILSEKQLDNRFDQGAEARGRVHVFRRQEGPRQDVRPPHQELYVSALDQDGMDGSPNIRSRCVPDAPSNLFFRPLPWDAAQGRDKLWRSHPVR